ncbi:MAG: YcxB family protein [Candidatus Acidiferrales bacterium]
MTVEYALTRGELVRVFLRSVSGSPRYRIKILLIAAAIGVFALVLRTTVSRSLTVRDGIVAIALAGSYLVLLPAMLFIRAKTGKRSLTIAPEGISTEIGRMKGQIPWRSVSLVHDLNEYVLIVRTSGNAFIIPRRAFSGAEERTKFLEEVNRYMRPVN